MVSASTSTVQLYEITAAAIFVFAVFGLIIYYWVLFNGISSARNYSNRTSWIYCPHCRRDLNGDNESMVSQEDTVVLYRCATCDLRSAFDLDAPIPIYLGSWSRT